MKHLLLTTIAAVLVGCATTQQQEPPTAKASDISIHMAVMKGHIEVVKHHLEEGADVNAKILGGGAFLHQAAYFGHIKSAALLIAIGADVNMRDEDGDTPLDWAKVVSEDDSTDIKVAKKETADFLRKHGGKSGEELKAEGK